MAFFMSDYVKFSVINKWKFSDEVIALGCATRWLLLADSCRWAFERNSVFMDPAVACFVKLSSNSHNAIDKNQAGIQTVPCMTPRNRLPPVL